jgi:peptidoglycan hydrolase CwlO-like protein
MKKVVFLLLILFGLGSVSTNPAPVSALSPAATPTPRKPETGDSRPTKSVTPLPEANDSYLVSIRNQKKNVLEQISTIEDKAKSLKKGGSRDSLRIELLEDIRNAKADLENPKTTDIELINRIAGRIKDFETLYQQLAVTPGRSGIDGDPALNASPAPAPSQTPQKSAVEEQDKPYSFWDWLMIGAIGLIVSGAIGTGIYFLFRSRAQEKARIQSSLNGLRARDSELSTKIEDFKKVITDLSQQVAQQKSDISRLKQGLASQPVYVPEPVAPAYPKEQPRFPVAVEDYLAKITESRPVRFDYKEAMLVPDTENSGGMILVKDDGQIYLIPSFKFFQTKNDYSNYLERYFDCARPMAGTVWIRQPATVTKSGSGWQVVTKGDLEVR